MALIITAAPAAHPSVLDWDNSTINWNRTWAGSPQSINQTFTNVDGSGINITVTLTRGSTASVSDVTNGGSFQPNDVNTPVTLLPGNETALRTDVNFDSVESLNEGLTFTVTFSQPVIDASFELWDIDLGNSGGSTYQDVIGNFTGTPTLTEVGNGTDLIVSGSTFRGVATINSTTNAGNENDTSGTGRGSVDYGSTLLTSFSFTYYSGNGSGSGVNFVGINPTLQRISLHDIYFTVVPEPSTYAAGLVLAGMAWLFSRRRSRPRD